MNKRKYPKLNRLYSLSNLPDSISEQLKDDSDGSILENVNSYYSEKEGISTVTYGVNTEDNETIRDSVLTVDQLGAGVESINQVYENFSEYDKNTLEQIGLNTENHWNGDLAAIRSDGEGFVATKTDFYSTAPVEMMLSAEISEEGPSPLRDEILSEKEDLIDTYRPIPARSSGCILTKSDGKWKLLLGKRSDSSIINAGKISLFPSGICEYEDLNTTVQTTVRRKFKEELFDSHSKGEMFYRKNVEPHYVGARWNARSGAVTFIFLLVIKSQVSHEILMNLSDYSDYLDETIEVDLDDIDGLLKLTQIDTISGSAVSGVFESLIYSDKSTGLPNLPYKIRRYNYSDVE